MNFESICLEVLRVAREAGNFIQENQSKINEEAVEEKSLNSLVTYVDKNSEMLIVKELEKLIPACGFITEEETIQKKGEVYNWIIDPLDGTTNFIHGIPCYCVSIGLTRNNQLVLGVIHDPNLNETFYAYDGGKAYMNGREIKVSKKETLKDSLLATGFPYYDYGKMPQYIELFKDFMQSSRGLRRLGSAAMDLAYVACGRFDGFYEYGLNPWDVAAGAYIIKQAGGSVTDFNGGDNYLFGEDIMVSNSLIHQEFLNKIQHHFS
jgi:myo-inositol-1(or 4)-monophosphatase